MSQSCDLQELSAIKQQAIDWLVLLRSDDMADDELCAFADWLAEDHSHSEAFAEAEALFEEMSFVAKYGHQVDEINSTPMENEPPPHLVTQKKTAARCLKHTFFSRWIVPSFAITALWLMMVSWFFPQQLSIFDQFMSDYHTKPGELRDIRLSDGSHLLLNTHSAVSIAYDDSIRKIVLHHGQVRFTVAKDVARPFIVDTEGLYVRALGTVFQIHKITPNNVKIIVQEHAVAVNKASDRQEDSVEVHSGQQLVHQLQQPAPQPKAIELMYETAWQQQRLIVNDRPLAELIAELERYRKGPIFIANDELKRLRITGVFSLKDPDAVLASVCKVLNLTETQLIDGWSIVHQ